MKGCMGRRFVLGALRTNYPLLFAGYIVSWCIVFIPEWSVQISNCLLAGDRAVFGTAFLKAPQFSAVFP
jgi:hypothetical protein